jgi:hypothetical protein
VGQARRGHQRGIADPDAVVDLVRLLQAAEDRDGLLDPGLAHVDLLEAPLEGRVLLDVLAVFVERRGADATQLAAGERRLHHVRRVLRALGLPRAHDGVDLVDEEDHVAFRAGDFLEDGLHPLLELAAELGSRDQRPHVEGEDAAVLQ